jgi:hypothetical protein
LRIAIRKEDFLDLAGGIDFPLIRTSTGGLLLGDGIGEGDGGLLGDGGEDLEVVRIEAACFFRNREDEQPEAS